MHFAAVLFRQMLRVFGIQEVAGGGAETLLDEGAVGGEATENLRGAVTGDVQELDKLTANEGLVRGEMEVESATHFLVGDGGAGLRRLFKADSIIDVFEATRIGLEINAGDTEIGDTPVRDLSAEFGCEGAQPVDGYGTAVAQQAGQGFGEVEESGVVNRLFHTFLVAMAHLLGQLFGFHWPEILDLQMLSGGLTVASGWVLTNDIMY